MKYYLFAKFFKHLSVDKLMNHCVESGINGPTAIIRKGYWMTSNNYKEALPKYIKIAEKNKLEVKYADLDYDMLSLINEPTPLKVLSENGVLYARVGYIQKKLIDARNLNDYSRIIIEKTTEIAMKCNIKIIIQIHGGCYPHNATAAYPLVKNLDPNYIGIKMDPGNNYKQEGYEDFSYQIQLLGEYLSAVGAKDACAIRKYKENQGNKGWETIFVPAFEGQSNYELIFKQLKKINFNGPMILMPFYDTDNFDLLFKKFKKEVEYFKDIHRRINQKEQGENKL